MIPNGTLSTCPDHPIPDATDLAAITLVGDLRRQHTRLRDFATTLDPKATPQGVADAIHDALTNLTDALQLAEAVSWGWNG